MNRCDKCNLQFQITIPVKEYIPYRVVEKELCVRCFNDLTQGRILTIDN